MKIKLYILTILIIGIFSSCEDTFTTIRVIDIPEHEAKLSVFVSMFTDTANVFISHSKEIDDETNYKQVEAEIKILENGNEIFNLDYNNVNQSKLPFLLDNLIKEGNEYTLIVDSEKYGVAKSTQIVPEKPIIKDIFLDKNIIIGQYGNKYNKFSFIIDDNKEIENFYIINFTGVFETPSPYGNRIYGETDDPIIKWVEFNNEYSYMLSDNNFNGFKRKVSFDLSDNYYGEDEINSYKVIVKVYSITKDQYNFSLSKEQAEESEYNPFAEPVAVTGNIENGYGLFSIYTYDTWIVEPE